MDQTCSRELKLPSVNPYTPDPAMAKMAHARNVRAILSLVLDVS
jgi:hypothetical protein